MKCDAQVKIGAKVPDLVPVDFNIKMDRLKNNDCELNRFLLMIDIDDGKDLPLPFKAI